MKNIFRLFMLPALAMPLLFTACDEDRDSNPTLDLSHVSENFVLNTPPYAQNNTYDLIAANNLTLTCSQPNYGGIPYVVRYYVQASIDNTFDELRDSTHCAELSTSFTTASMNVDASELNGAVVAMYQKANPTEAVVPDDMPVYIRLRAVLNGTNDATLGQTYSNVITLPHVKATYEAPDATYPDQLFIVGSSIQTSWQSWKRVQPVSQLKGMYFTMAYFDAGAEFKWGFTNNDYRGINSRLTIDDQASAGISEGDQENIKVANAGWYVLYFEGAITSDNKNIDWTLHFYPAHAYIIGANAGGDWTDSNSAWELTPSATKDGQWESPAFQGGGELRAYVKVPGFDWWRTEFTLYNGSLYWRNFDIPDNWGSNVGTAYSVSGTAGQKLYVNFDANTGEVR